MRDVKCFDLLLEPINIQDANVTNVKIMNPTDAVAIVNKYYNLNKSNREKAVVVGLNAAGYITGMHQISAGMMSSTKCAPDQIFKFLLLTNSSYFIMMHNHPAGECKQSKDDEQVTARILHCAKMMGVRMIDHIIITHDNFMSMRQDTAVFDLV